MAESATFSVVLFTAAPAGMAAESGGAYVKLDGREALLRSVELFLNRENVKQIQLVVLDDTMDEAKRKYGGHLGFSGVKLIGGGERLIDQLAAAAEKLSADCTHVIIHDAARPVVPYTDIEALMETAERDKKPIVALASVMRSPLVEVDEGGNAMAYHRPERFMYLLTPQAFTREKFLEVVNRKQEPHASEVTLLKASPLNVRIGGSGDERLARAMLQMMPKPKVKPPSSPFEEAQW